MDQLAGRAGARLPSQYRLRFSERRLLLTGLDLVALLAALDLTLAWRLGPGFDWRLPVLQQPQWFLILAAIWLVIAAAFDAYEPRVAARLSASVLAVIKAGAVTAGLYLLVPHITPPLPTSRLELFAFPLVIVAALVVDRAFHTLAFPRPAFRQRALIVGAGRAGRLIARTLAEAGDDSYQVLGFLADAQPATEAGGGVDAGTGSDHPAEGATPAPLAVLGAPTDLQGLIARHEISSLILSPAHDVDATLLQTLLECVERGVELVPMAVLYERLTGRVPVEQVRDDWYVAIPVEQLTHSSVRRMTKRLMDVALASLGLVCLALLLPFVALAIRLDSRGPVFYAQERVGIGGRVFRAYKFRSMVVGAERDGAVWARRRDPRVTRVGRVLRASHLDEFPQLWNVMRGEMSAVGPRPERPEFVEKLAAELPLYRLRHVVKPGMAGWGLIRQGYAASEADVLVRLQYDLYYIKYQSPWLDLVILLKTIADALWLRGL